RLKIAMTSKHNFNLNDDNFWTKAFRLCDELQSGDADSDVEEKEEVTEAPPLSSRPPLALKGAAKREEEENAQVPAALPVDQWDAVKEEGPKARAARSMSWELQQTASTPDLYSEEEVEIWSVSSPSHSAHGHHPRLSSQHIPVMDDKYMEYYEFLSDGFNKLFKDIDDQRTSLPPWALEAGDVRRGADLERAERFGRFSRSRLRPPPPLSSSPFASSIECGEKAGLGCSALKPKLYHQYNPGPEVYSRKVFVGGLPVDVDEDELLLTFSPFGHLTIDWPNKLMHMQGSSPDRSYPHKGYVFLIFQYEMSVRKLVEACHCEEEKLFFCISSTMNPQKMVQIRPWKLADADYIVDVNIPINPRRVIFVGGVPRPIRAVELAHIMDKLYGSVVCAGIDTDLEYKYPKGAGRVAFTNECSFIRAITDRYAQLSHGERVRVEMKPYVLDDQPCDECDGNAARHAPFFCPHLECLQYYCESCWTELHACPTREHHKPLVKEA
ncbi:hypothetical protein PENTCL1PPCAC_13617, partial [Pristionchus entomophagus]